MIIFGESKTSFTTHATLGLLNEVDLQKNF
jgi:hypothetical protein